MTGLRSRLLRLLFAAYMAGGNATILANLQSAIDDRDDVDADFVPVEMDSESRRQRGRGELGRRSFIPGTIRNSLITHHYIHELEHDGREFDAAWFFQQTICMGLPGFRHRVPYVIALDGTPRWYLDQGFTYAQNPYDPAKLTSRAKQWMIGHVYRSAFHVLPLSETVRASLIHDYDVPPERVTVMPPGVDLRRFSVPDRVARAEAGGPLRALFVGADFQRKGGDLVTALAAAPEFADVEFHLVTRSFQGTRTDNVVIHDDVTANSDALLAHYQAADVFVLPTREDSYSIASVEAMATGLPVITTPTGGIPDIVVDGGTGYLVPRDDVAAVAERLRALRDPALRLRLGAAARARAEEKYDGVAIAARTVEILKQAATSRA